MGIELIDESKVYELKHPSGAVFKLKHWTLPMQEETDKQCIIIDVSTGRVKDYKTSLEREIKLGFSLVGWYGVSFNGEEVPCTGENKKKLPVGIILWLVREIDERSGLRISEEEKKN